MKTKTAERVSDETLGVEEAANLLHVGYDAMKQLIDSGEVPAVVLSERHAVLLREELIAYIREEGRRQADERRKLHRQVSPRVEPKLKGSARASAIMDKFEAAEEKRIGQLGKAGTNVPADFDRMIRLNDVLAMVGVSRPSLYRLMRDGQFPLPMKINTMSAWLTSDVVDYIKGKKGSRGLLNYYKNNV